MKYILPFAFVLCFTLICHAQQSQPWERPLIICSSHNGINFSVCSTFQDSSGVPSLAMDSSGRIISAFQWFPDPLNGPHWDSVAVKLSIDSGMTWTGPHPISIQNFPANFQRPFDPTVVGLPGGQIRIYFSSGPPGPNTIATYSASGTDGINYIFEPGIRFSQTGRNCIDPAVTIYQGIFHYTSPKGAPQDGAFHAISSDGLLFSQLADVSSDTQHNWTGNMIVDSLAIKFYGCGGSSMWFSASGNGNQWSPYQQINLSGGDPAVLKIPGRNNIIVYTGPPATVDISQYKTPELFDVFPNPVKDELNILGLDATDIIYYEIFDFSGRILTRGFVPENRKINLALLRAGIYILKIHTKSEIGYKFIELIH